MAPALPAPSVKTTDRFKNSALSFSPDATMDENLTSQTIDMQGASSLSVTLHAASATHVGTVAVDVSDDGVNWNALTLDSTPAAANEVAFDAVLLLQILSAFVRLRYVFTSGTGTLTGAYTVKG